MNVESLLVIDGHALIYRAFHAFPQLTNKQGLLVNAVYGFTRILLTAIRDLSPDYIAVAFDHPQPTFRHTEFVEYKAQREKMPDELIAQIDLIKQVVTALNIPQFIAPGFEADDLIGTLVCELMKHHTPKTEQHAVILTGDRDSLQLVTDHVHVLIPGRNKNHGDTEYDPATVKEKMGVTPAQVIDLKGLMGDSSDNIPGVRGIGKVTATKLIQEFGSIESLYQAVDRLEADQTAMPPASLKGSVLTKLIKGRELAFLSKSLATIKCDVPMEFNLGDCRVEKYDKAKVEELFAQLDFHSLKPLLPMDEFEKGVQNALF